MKLRISGRYANFYCPGCKDTHTITISGDKAWHWNQSTDSPTFTPSILIRVGHYVPGHPEGSCWCTFNKEHADNPAPFVCMICHSYIANGQIQFLGDCAHALAGQTVDLPEIPKGTFAE